MKWGGAVAQSLDCCGKASIKLRAKGANVNEYEQIMQQLAKGLSYRESVEEYQRDENGKLVLIKKRETTKHAIPDFQALKFLLEQGNTDISHWTDTELIQEKMRLLKELAEMENRHESGV